MNSVQDKGFYVIHNDSVKGSQTGIDSHGSHKISRGLEKDVADRSLNSWRTTWEPDTLLETPEVATIGRPIIEDVAFPSAISAMNELAPRTSPTPGLASIFNFPVRILILIDPTRLRK